MPGLISSGRNEETSTFNGFNRDADLPRRYSGRWVTAAQFVCTQSGFRSGVGRDENGKPPATPAEPRKVMVTASRVSGSTFAPLLMNETLS
ncbi:hypothetical protein KIF59_01770 [Enterobacter cloacae subsp. cloacae]|nr:hypothetical protein [Enterobacter cloacae subsp. cloacae]